MSDEVHNHGLEGTETREEIEQVKISTSQSQVEKKMSSNNTERREDIQLAEVTTLKNRQACTSRAETEVVTFKNAMGVTEGKELLDEIKEVNISIRGASIDDMAKIQKVPEIMLRNNEEIKQYFKPRELSIGPIHAADPNLSKKELKLKLAAHFFKKCSSKEGDGLLEQIKTEIKDIKTCFKDEVIKSYTDDKLICLLFLDGCAMLGFIHCYLNWELEVVGISDAQAADMEQDLLLLENQIPFRVLEVLIGSGTDKGKENRKGRLVITFIYHICWGIFPRHSTEDLYEHLDKYCFSPEINNNPKAVHLLDVFREALLFNPPSFDLFWCLLTVIRGAFWILCSCGCLAISYFLERFKPRPDYNIISLYKRVKEAFFSVQELKAAGIKFKPSHSLKTVSFRSLFFFRPQLMLPTLIVDNSTAYKLVNLVAYENCLSNDHPNKEPWVTSYVNLLDSLVDNEQDIKDLRAADILRNTLSTDKDAAELINDVGTGCIAPAEDAYEDVKEKIGKYYRTTCAVWMAQVCSTHFSSPWTIIALFAATAVLLLTAFQTWYAVNPKK